MELCMQINFAPLALSVLQVLLEAEQVCYTHLFSPYLAYFFK